MKLKLYGAMLYANTRTKYGFEAQALRAASEDEARGIALRTAKERYPPALGWESHSVAIVTIPQNWINEAAE